MFGSLKFGGRFSISDAYPVAGHSPTLEQRNGVGIDRFTGGTVRGVLFDLQALTGGKFNTHLSLLNFELWQLAALHMLLIDLKDEMISIGSGRSRGLGRVQGAVTSFQLSYVPHTDHVAGLYEFATDEEKSQYQLHDWLPKAAIPLEQPVRRGIREVFDLTSNWNSQLESLSPSFEQFLMWHSGPKGEVSDRNREEANT